MGAIDPRRIMPLLVAPACLLSKSDRQIAQGGQFGSKTTKLPQEP